MSRVISCHMSRIVVRAGAPLASPDAELLEYSSPDIDGFLAFAFEPLHVHAVAHLQFGLRHELCGVDPVLDPLEILDPRDAGGVFGVLDRAQQRHGEETVLRARNRKLLDGSIPVNAGPTGDAQL